MWIGCAGEADSMYSVDRMVWSWGGTYGKVDGSHTGLVCHSVISHVCVNSTAENTR